MALSAACIGGQVFSMFATRSLQGSLESFRVAHGYGGHASHGYGEQAVNNVAYPLACTLAYPRKRAYKPAIFQYSAVLKGSFKGLGSEGVGFLQPAGRLRKNMMEAGRSMQLTHREREIGGLSVRMETPDFLPSAWGDAKKKNKPLGPSLEFSAEETVMRQLGALRENDHPYPDHGVEIMYRFAGFDPFQRSRYFGPRYDLGQFERFRRLFHHSTYRVLLCHTDVRVLSTFYVNEHLFKQRVWVKGARPGEDESFEFTLVQRVGGSWDGYWLTDSLIHDGDGLSHGIAY
eukprot:jgi/Mesen1/2571/ME000162S01697